MGSDMLAHGQLLSQKWGSPSAEEFGFSAGPEAWKVLWKKVSKLPLFIRALFGAAAGGVEGAVIGGDWGELMEDRRSVTRDCLLWPGMSEAGPSALLRRPCMK